jgi:hypothetical protein
VDRGTAWFWDALEEHKLLIQRCASCGTLRAQALPMCANCQSLEWDTQEATGRGTVHTWLVSQHPTEESESRIVALIDLEEGVRIVSNIVDADPHDVAIGAPVELTFRTYGDVTLHQFLLVRS